MSTYGNGATSFLGVRTYVRADSHVTTKIFRIDGLPKFLRYGARLESYARCAIRLERQLMILVAYVGKSHENAA